MMPMYLLPFMHERLFHYDAMMECDYIYYHHVLNHEYSYAMNNSNLNSPPTDGHMTCRERPCDNKHYFILVIPRDRLVIYISTGDLIRSSWMSPW